MPLQQGFHPSRQDDYHVVCCTRGVAQLGSALRSGRRGRGFKSRHPDDEDVRELARETSEEEGVERPKGLSTPTMRRPASSLAGLLPSQGRRDQFSPAGVDQPYGSVSTALTSTAPASMCPAGIVGMPQFRPGMQRQFGADVSTMDTDTPQSLGAVLCPTVKPPHVAGVRSGATSRFTVTPDRLHCTKVGRHGTKVGRTPWGSGVRAVHTTHGQRLPTLGQWEPGARLPAERSTLR